MPAAKAYDHIVGLGLDCRLAYNLRRTFGFERAYPFDWWVTPLASLTEFLRDPSLERLYAPDLLRPVMAEGKAIAIENAHYGITLYHDFPRDWRTAALHEAWRQHLPAARARTTHLVERLLNLPVGERVLFVRNGRASERRELGDRYLSLVGEAEAALRARFARHDFDLLLIDPPAPIEGPNLMSLQIQDPNQDDWRGTPDLWRERLLGAGLSWTGQPASQGVEPDPKIDMKRFDPRHG